MCRSILPAATLVIALSTGAACETSATYTPIAPPAPGQPGMPAMPGQPGMPGQPAMPAMPPQVQGIAPRLAGPFLTPPTETQIPPAVNPVPVATPVFYCAWMHPSLPAAEVVTITLVAVNVGAAAPPNTTVVSTQVNAVQAGPNHGTANFSMPTAGWPPGQYRVTAAGSTLGPFGFVDLAIQ